MKNIEHRLRRLQGQLASLEVAIHENYDCENVIPQFLAVKGAVHGAFVAYVEASLEACSKKDTDKLQKLMALLIKN